MFTDTDTDVTPKEAKEYGYNLISMPYTVDDVEIHPYVDFDVFDDHAFYEKLRQGALPHTSAISPEGYKTYFEPHFAAGNDVMYVHFSTAMSGTFDAMKLAVDELLQKYPDRKFYEIDTKGITIGSLNIVLEIGEMYKNGATAEEMLKWAETEVDKFAVYFYADDLKFFRRSGRVSNFSGLMGNLLGIKPIIYMGSDGKMTSLAKCRGRKATLEKIVEYVVTLQDDVKNHRVLIGHADAPEIARQLAEMLKEKLGDDLNIQFVAVNPTAGSHCGPDTVGVSFHAIHR